MAHHTTHASPRIISQNLFRSANFRRLWIPAFFCTLLLAAEMYALFYDFQESPWVNLGTRPIIAVYREGKNEVRNKRAGTISWIAPTLGEELRTEDAIATMSEAFAKVEFIDGSEMEIEPNSLVIFERPPSQDDRRITARLLRGGLKIKKTSRTPILLKAPVAKADGHRELEEVVIEDRSDATRFQIEKRDTDANLKVSVLDGKVEIKGQAIEQNQSAEVGKDGVELVKPTSEPKPMLKAPTLKKPKVKIRNSQNDQKKLLNSSLRRILNSLVAFLSPISAWSAPPSDSLETLPKKQTKKAEIELEWDAVEGASSYRIQIATDPEFLSPVVDEKTVEANFEYEAYTTKDLYYRVAAIDSSGNQSEFSEAQEIDIESQVKVAEEKRRKQRKKVIAEKPKPIIEKKEPPVVHVPEEPPFDRYNRFGASLGAAFHSRKFSGEERPTSTEASGIVPAALTGEFRRAMSKDLSIQAGLFVLLESGTPSTVNVEKESQGMPLLRAWGMVEKTYGEKTFGIGPYASSSNSFSWSGRKAVIEQKYLFGATAQISSRLSMETLWPWRIQLSLLGLGAIGGDLNAFLRRPIQKRKFVSLLQYQGIFAEAEVLGRITTIETAFGGLLKVGYAF